MTRLTDEELDRLAEKLWKRLRPLAKSELERMFTNYMATRTLLEPELIAQLFKAMEKDLNKFLTERVRLFARKEEDL